MNHYQLTEQPALIKHPPPALSAEQQHRLDIARQMIDNHPQLFDDTALLVNSYDAQSNTLNVSEVTYAWEQAGLCPHGLAGVHVLIYRDGQMLWQKRSEQMVHYPNYWTSSASGGISASQTALQAAQAELFEELGVHAHPQARQLLLTTGPLNKSTVIVFEMSVDQKFAPSLSDEVQDLQWLDIAKAPTPLAPDALLIHHLSLRNNDALKNPTG